MHLSNLVSGGARCSLTMPGRSGGTRCGLVLPGVAWCCPVWLGAVRRRPAYLLPLIWSSTMRGDILRGWEKP